MIRAVRPTDVAGLRAFIRRPGVSEITTHTWPKVQPESGRLQLGAILTRALGRGWDRLGAWVAKQDGRLVGYVVARARCDGVVWDVEQLIVDGSSTDAQSAAIDLLDHVCGKVIERGGRRVFLDVPDGSVGVSLARKAGFQRYAGSTLGRLDPPFKVDKNSAFSARPRLRADEHELYQLYNAAVPAQARAAEAMSYEEWASLHRGKRRWAPSLLGDRQQYVWEMGSGLVAWLEVVFGQRSQYLDFLVDPHFDTMLDRLIAYGLTLVSDKAPVYATARDYQATLWSALQRAGFEPASETEIMVRQLAARVPEPKLVPAKLLGG
jgi:hypothetical protein